MEPPSPVLDLSFPVQGSTIPADHGFPLYSAISRLIPGLHGDPQLGIHPIRGLPAGGRRLRLTPSSHLTVRLPADRMPEILPLAGKRLDLGDSQIGVGVPTVRPLRPVTAVASRLVTIRGFTDGPEFIGAVRRQLALAKIAGEVSLLVRRHTQPVEGGAGSSDPYVRRTVRIHDREIVGFAVGVSQLPADESIRLQEVGLGGRRRFGCGIFVPAGRDR